MNSSDGRRVKRRETKGTTIDPQKLTPETVTAAGGKMWEKGAMRRAYWNDLATLAGWSIAAYKTGNISSASCRGQAVSNSYARQNAPDGMSRFWLDLDTGTFHAKNLRQSDFEHIVSVVSARLQGA